MMKRLIHFERKSQPLLPRRLFYGRLFRNIAAGSLILSVCLLIGILGYHETCSFSWIDSLLNASMILSGMGPTNPIETLSGKLFASFYALFSGVVFISTIGLALTPVVHRIFHHFHLAEEQQG
ncbi:MAG: hypothetical protein WCR52_01435 [Bacteroidota bacterium]